MMNNIFLLFLGALLGDLLAIGSDNKLLEYLCKPALMLLLGFYSYKKMPHIIKRDKFLMAALVFSWFGDVFLMFTNMPNSFICGLGVFLVAHICLVCTFSSTSGKFALNYTKISPRLPFYIAILVFGISIFTYLYPNLGKMLPPVVVYISAILSMLIVVFRRWKRVPMASFHSSWWGAFSFAISDSIIAINKFVNTIPYHEFLIITLYALGQWYIVKGYFLAEEEK